MCAERGFTNAVFRVSYDIVKGNLHDLSVWTMGAAAYNALRALLEGGDDLILVSQWGEVWRCQVGPDIGEDWQRAAPTGSETTPLGQVRIFDFSLVSTKHPVACLVHFQDDDASCACALFKRTQSGGEGGNCWQICRRESCEI